MTLATWDEVRQLTDTVQRLADWRDDLLSRIERRQIYVEQVNAWAGHDDLALEVRAFRDCCREMSEGRTIERRVA
jgi:hypothetical protein